MANLFEIFENLLSGDTPPTPPSINDLNYTLSNIRLDNFPTINTNSKFSIDSIPNINTHVSASVDKLAPINLNAAVTELPEIKAKLGASFALEKLPDINISAGIKSLPKILLDAGLNDLRVKELAPINLQFSLKPARLKLPFGYSFKVGIFGLEIFSVQMQGEVKAELDDL
ncbi:hypothetical protein [Ketobacter sp.]|uniref:hypothetical protein n=1 Tax=Ketobacter sp. TaxID=2083498 RepID=UPI000F233293|nr:hypothetical protein [Ketobacter sp.]RLT98048.1 MAG: hypothetical protein D9N14_10470 [Ketobacter sp.]